MIDIRTIETSSGVYCAKASSEDVDEILDLKTKAEEEVQDIIDTLGSKMDSVHTIEMFKEGDKFVLLTQFWNKVILN